MSWRREWQRSIKTCSILNRNIIPLMVVRFKIKVLSGREESEMGQMTLFGGSFKRLITNKNNDINKLNKTITRLFCIFCIFVIFE